MWTSRVMAWGMAFALVAAAQAQPVDSLADGRSGDIGFNSFNPRGHGELGQGTFDRKPVPITGHLSLPAATEAKVPAIVIGHTANGVHPILYSRWAKALNDAGYAAFVVDSFKPRGIVSVSGRTAAEFTGAVLIPDAFMALQLLATHPRIDAQRIAFVGFSQGGITAPYLLHERFRKAVLGDSPLRFAALVGHYGGCFYNFVENQPSRTPLYMFLAQKDDWLSPASCQAFVAHLAEKGYTARVQVYEGAAHAYDADRPLAYEGIAVNTMACKPLVVNLDEPVLAPRYLEGGGLLAPNADPAATARQVFQWHSSCTKRGANFGITPGPGDRREDSVRDTLTALQEAFAAQPR